MIVDSQEAYTKAIRFQTTEEERQIIKERLISQKKTIVITGGDLNREDRRRNNQYSQEVLSHAYPFINVGSFDLSLTPHDSAQDLIDSVEYSIEDQTDLNLTKCCRRMKWNTMQN